jgi:molybdopterin converting factor small subunit
VATVLLPRSLLALFPGAERRHDVEGQSVAVLLERLDGSVPGLRDRLVEAGPRLRPHINVFVDGLPADLATPVSGESVVHVIPAVSGGSRAPDQVRRPSVRSNGSNASVRSATASRPR